MLSRAASPVATIRASVLIPIVRALDLATTDTDRLLARHGLARSGLRDPYASVPLGLYVAFLEAAALCINEPGLGARLGTMLRPIDLGPAGLLFAVAPTLRQGLGHLGRYLGTVQGATLARLQEHDGWAAWVYRVEDPAIWPRAQDSELTLATMCSLVRSRFGRHWAPLAVHFEHAGEGRDPALRALFGAPVLFRQPATQLLLDPADLDRQLRADDAAVIPVLERHAQDLLDRDRPAQSHEPLPVSDRVRRLIGARIATDTVTVDSLASDLGISARSLQRRLAEEGTSLRELLRAHRRQLAERRLTSGDASHAVIAQAMGYSDATVFWRAFKRWSGASPTAFRSRARGGARS